MTITHNLDATDLQILRLLQDDADITTKKLAAKINLTTTPVHDRIKRMRNQGFIQKYVALLDRQRLGLHLLAFCNVHLKQHVAVYFDKFEKDVQSLEGVQEVYHIAGNYDYLLKVIVPDINAYYAFVSHQLAALENIGRVQSSFVMKEIMHSTRLPL